MSKLGRKRSCYSSEFRFYHVNKLLELNVSVQDYCDQFGLSVTSMYRWLDHFSQEVDMNKKKDETRLESKGSEDQRIAVLEEEIARLKTQLHHEQLKRVGYEKMISIAEQTFKISIAKKSGTKQSKR